MNDTRAYNSPSREQAKSDTKAAIVDAVVRVILEQGIHAFTMQNVAEAAGVSQRTVYRHFESREALLEGLQDAIQRHADEVGLPVPRDVAEAIPMAGPLFEEFYAMGDAMHASVIASIALGYQTEQQRGSLEYLYAMLEKRFTHVPEEELRDAAAVLRCLFNRYTWYVLAIQNQVPAKAGGRAIGWSARVLLAELERSDRTHAKSPRSRVKSSKTKTRTKTRTKTKTKDKS